MDVEYIKKTVNDIRNSTESEDIIRKKHGKFAEDNPRLFEFCIDKTIELKYLDMMFEQIGHLNESSINLDVADSNVYGILKGDFLPKEYNE